MVGVIGVSAGIANVGLLVGVIEVYVGSTNVGLLVGIIEVSAGTAIMRFMAVNLRDIRFVIRRRFGGRFSSFEFLIFLAFLVLTI